MIAEEPILICFKASLASSTAAPSCALSVPLRDPELDERDSGIDVGVEVDAWADDPSPFVALGSACTPSLTDPLSSSASVVSTLIETAGPVFAVSYVLLSNFLGLEL